VGDVQQSEITREDFVRGARVIVGDQVLVQTIRQMHGKVRRLRVVWENIAGVALVKV
jgi:hypothetical protein